MRITDLKNAYRGWCFILGNGPSLSGVDFRRLGSNVVFGTNRIYLSGYVPDYYVCVNDLVLRQFADEIGKLQTVKFLGDRANITNQCGEVIPIQTTNPGPGFYSPEKNMWEGHTVTYVCLQIARYMGFDKAVLLGVDHDYGDIGEPNRREKFKGEDTKHFHQDYFKDHEWHTPDLRMSEIAYSLANKNIEVINCTGRTKLEVFPILPLNHVLGPQYRVSAVVSAYYAEPWMEECMRDLNTQSEKPEIVVVCKAGSMEEEVAKAWQANQIIATDGVPNLASAWNIGAKAARGRYIIPACTDDRLHPRALEIMADALDGRPDIDIVYADVFVSWEQNVNYEQFTTRHTELVYGRVEGKPGIYAWQDYDRRTLGHTCYIGPQPVYRANLHQRFGWFDEEFTSAMDYEFWLRCAGEKNYLHLPYPLGVYQARADSLEYRTKDISILESEIARRRYGAGQITIIPHGEEVRIDVQNRWGYVAKADIKRLAVEL